jgi:CHASE2 domain-containing sensor protein
VHGEGKIQRIWAGFRDFGRGYRGMFFIKALVPIALSAWITFGNPLDIGSSSQRYSRDVWNAIFGAAAPDTAADQIAVVVANDTTLHALGQAWPLPYAVHADIISAILADKPRVLVIDILFVDEKRRDGTIDALAEAIAAAGDTRVVLAAAPHSAGGGVDILGALQPANLGSGGAHVALGSAETSSKAGAPSPYWLQAETGPPSIALTAYSQWCAEELSRPGGQKFCAEPPKRAVFDAEMEIFWPIGSLAQDRAPGVECAQPPAEPIARIYEVIRAGFALAALRQSCTPFPSILAQTILRPQGHEETISQSIKDKAVFYGMSIVGSADIVEVLHVRHPLPGVYVHAAAFENLLRMGRNYLRHDTQSSWISEDDIEFVYSSALTVFIFLAALYAQKIPQSTPHRAARIVLVTVAALCAILCAVFALLWVEYSILRVAPSNWIGLLALSLAASAVIEPAFEARPASATKEQ